jgi:hypothetical protein
MRKSVKALHPLFVDLAQRHRTPLKVQKFIRSLDYNTEKDGISIRSALGAVQVGKAHCIEAAFVAAALLEVYDYPPLILDLESKDGLDHVVFVFKKEGRWGAIGRSSDPGLEGRAPVFRSVRELAWSYFDPYIDKTGRLKAFRLVHLDECEANWRTSPRNVWKAENYLLSITHSPIGASQARYKKIYKAFLRGGKIAPKNYWW